MPGFACYFYEEVNSLTSVLCHKTGGSKNSSKKKVLGAINPYLFRTVLSSYTESAWI